MVGYCNKLNRPPQDPCDGLLCYLNLLDFTLKVREIISRRVHPDTVSVLLVAPPALVMHLVGDVPPPPFADVYGTPAFA